VGDEFLVICPYCGERVEIYVEPDLSGTFIQDCDVCCNPWRVQVSGTKKLGRWTSAVRTGRDCPFNEEHDFLN
jgi:Cysteine-rich CPXCG